MKVGHSELKRRISDLTRKRGVGNRQMELLIDSLWRDLFSLRTSGFKYAGGTDASISLVNGGSGSGSGTGSGSGSGDNALTFTVSPLTKKFSFYQYITKLSFHKKYDAESVAVPTEEGIHYIYFSQDPDTKEQVLYVSDGSGSDDDNPTFDWLIVNKCMVASVYWDDDNSEAIVFNDQRYGSEWNPQMHKTFRLTLGSLRDYGLAFTDMDPDGDGSEESHAEFGISAGAAWHGDIKRTSAGVVLGAAIKIMYFNASNYPRIVENAGWPIMVGTLLQYQDGGALVDAMDEYFVLYHIFFTNCQYNEFISVPGVAQYETLSDAQLAMLDEQETVKALLPYTDVLLVGTLIYQTSADFTNSVHSRIVSNAWTVFTEMSITGDGSLINKVKLLNDEEDPGSYMYYGTDSYGIKGWHKIGNADETSGSGSGEEEPNPWGSSTEPQHFDWPDIESGEAQTYPICPYVPYSGTLQYIALKADATMDDVSLTINGAPVEFSGAANSIDITTSMVKYTITGYNSIVEGDLVELVTSGTDGGATRLMGTLLIQKS